MGLSASEAIARTSGLVSVLTTGSQAVPIIRRVTIKSINLVYFASKRPSLFPNHFVVGACIKIVIRIAINVTDVII